MPWRPQFRTRKPRLTRFARRWLDDVVAGTIDLTKLRPSFAADVRLPRARTALRNLALYGPRRYTLVSVDRRSPTSTYAYLLQTRSARCCTSSRSTTMA